MVPNVNNYPRPYPQLPPPLWVRVTGPAGMQVTFYRGTFRPETLTVPFMVALRPGYVYRVRLSDIPNHPGLELFPTLEVRGSLRNECHFQARDFPATFRFGDEDFQPARATGLVTRVVTLERAETALPLQSSRDDPLEFTLEPGTDPVRVASERGIPLLIVRLGQRRMSEEELKACGIPGTIWLPGDKGLAIPPVAPWLPWACPSLYDPYLGPAFLSPAICLPDGGDTGTPAGLDPFGRLQGLDPSDTVAEYVDSAGQRRIACSNRICLCVPRFLVYRGVVQLEKNVAVFGPGNVQLAQGPLLAGMKVPPLVQHQYIRLEDVVGRQAPSEASAPQATVVVGQYEGVEFTTRLEGPRGVSSICLTPTGELPERCLCVIKFPDRYGALIGDVVTMTLKYSNQGGRPIRNIVVSDSLVSRFEYIQGSARSDRAANFTTLPNDAGSLILRWQITDDLPPGQTGTITFQVRIR
jgi:uncharacterized repeat protein (TIGR01451 family)